MSYSYMILQVCKYSYNVIIIVYMVQLSSVQEPPTASPRSIATQLTGSLQATLLDAPAMH